MALMQLLDNIFWYALTGYHAEFAWGHGPSRRYAPGFSPILAFADPHSADLACLRRHCRAGETFYTDGWSGPVPDGWELQSESQMVKMVWRGGTLSPFTTSPAVRLKTMHSPQIAALMEETHPGPFGRRNIELGEYFGLFEGERLVAMAGERSHAASLREISGVCTHPRYQGRGLAKLLVRKLVARQQARGELPFLHVMRDNEAAHAMYERMGFTDHKTSVVRVISRCAD